MKAQTGILTAVLQTDKNCDMSKLKQRNDEFMVVNKKVTFA